MLQANVHVEVFNVDVQVADSVLVVGALDVEVLDNLLEHLDILLILQDALLISIHRKSYGHARLDQCPKFLVAGLLTSRCSQFAAPGPFRELQCCLC